MILYKALVSNIDCPMATGANIVAMSTEGGQFRLVGSLGLRLSAPGGFVNSLFVHEDFRGKGIGRELLRQASEVAQQHGKRTLGLTVHMSNLAAQQLYLSMGFQPYGLGKQDFYHEYVAMLPLKA